MFAEVDRPIAYGTKRERTADVVAVCGVFWLLCAKSETSVAASVDFACIGYNLTRGADNFDPNLTQRLVFGVVECKQVGPITLHLHKRRRHDIACGTAAFVAEAAG